MQNSKTTDHINHPSHYGGDSTYEAVNVIEAWGLGWHLGDAVAYIARAGKKPNNPELQDLKKARWYIDRRIAQLEKPNNDVPVSTEPEKQLLTWEQAYDALNQNGAMIVSHLDWHLNDFVRVSNGYILDSEANCVDYNHMAAMSAKFYIINH